MQWWHDPERQAGWWLLELSSPIENEQREALEKREAVARDRADIADVVAPILRDIVPHLHSQVQELARRLLDQIE